MTIKSFPKWKAVVIAIALWPIFLLVEGVLVKSSLPYLFDNTEPTRLSYASSMGSTYSYEKDTDLIAARAAWAARPVDWIRVFVIAGLLLLALLFAAVPAWIIYARAGIENAPTPNHLIDRPSAR
jgi:hypothetical protein